MYGIEGLKWYLYLPLVLSSLTPEYPKLLGRREHYAGSVVIYDDVE